MSEPEAEVAADVSPRKTQIYAYRDFVGIQCGDVIVVKMSSQIRRLVEVSEVEISAEAFEVMRKLRPAKAVPDVVCFHAQDGRDYFGWLGGPFKVIDPLRSDAHPREYHPNLLRSRVADVPAPPHFVQAVEAEIGRRLAGGAMMPLPEDQDK